MSCTDFENEVDLFENRIDTATESIIKHWVSFTGLKVPRSYVLPPIELSKTEKILSIGVRPNYNFLQKELGKSRLMLEEAQLPASFLAELEAFLQAAAVAFNEDRFEQIDELWLGIKRNHSNTDGSTAPIETIQLIMDKLYERPYDFVVCGDYSYNKQKIWLYIKNIEKRLCEDKKYALIPAQQVLECMLAHELFHSLHFMALHDACIEKGTVMLKLFNPLCLTEARRNQLRSRRKTVLESLAKYFEYSYARERGFTPYASYEREGFVGRRKHYPAWPYAGAKGLVQNDNDDAFLQALRASVDLKHGHGFAEAYDIIDKANSI